MDSVRGRHSDVIKTPSGIKLFGDFLTTIFDDYPNTIREFQIVQAKDYSVKLFYVPVPNIDHDPIIKLVKNKLDLELNAEIVTKYYAVDKVEKLNGKTPFIISHIL
jgi:phenylacetate-CoA ligase